MRLVLHDRRWRRLALAGMALYALFVLVAPFEHHDFSCELKNPQHCTSCTSSVVSSDPDSLAVRGLAELAYAGSASQLVVTVDGALLAVRSTGRSPPASL
jgi:hypothetical protein